MKVQITTEISFPDDLIATYIAQVNGGSFFFPINMKPLIENGSIELKLPSRIGNVVVVSKTRLDIIDKGGN